MQPFDLPLRARPEFVNLLPGGRMEFPKDPVGEAYRSRMVREQAAAQGRKLTRRISKEEK